MDLTKRLWFGYVISCKTLDKGVLEYFGRKATHLARNLAAWVQTYKRVLFSICFLFYFVLFFTSIILFYYAGIAVIEIFCVAMCAFFIHLFLTNR